MEGIDPEAVGAWITSHVPGTAPPYRFELIPGGRSNLTFAVEDGNGRRLALRRPPVSHVLPTAHDMGREHRIISALASTPVPVAPALGYCEDAGVNGSPFYVMGFVDGHVVRDGAAARLLGDGARRHAGEALVDVLADLHAVDPDAVGLGDLGRREGYIARQLRRWHRQYSQSTADGLATVPAIDTVHDELAARMPGQGPATIVHGDYRLDNTILGDDGEVRAVIDWEICTLGDPLADVGLLLVYWTEPGEESPLADAPTTVEGFATRAELVARYGVRTGRAVGDLSYYVAFGYWKLACILQGVVARFLSGAAGGDRTGMDDIQGKIAWLAARAEATLSVEPG